MNRRFSPIALLTALLLAGCGGSSPPPAITIRISPSTVTVAPGLSVSFTVTVTNASNTAVTWEVNSTAGGNASVGTISSQGVYVAPKTEPKPPNVNVQAVSQADPTKSAAALVTIGQPAGSANQAAQQIPIKLGTSGGNSLDSTTTGNTITCCSGTLGSLIERAGAFYILSNNHVLARSDQGKKGVDPIAQPGLVDSNCAPAATVATLTDFVTLPEGGTSTAPKTGTVDAAIAEIIPGAVDTSGTILELGTASSTSNIPNPAPPAGTTVAPAIGMGVAKAGRSSGLTCSTIRSINTIVDISYSTACSGGTTFFVRFDNQIVINGSSFSAAGDSGSLIVNSGTAQPVGLLYGGDSTSTVANPIAAVLNALADKNGNVPTIVGGAEHPIACPSTATAAPANAQASKPLAPAQLTHATQAANRYATGLLANPRAAGVAVGRSQDDPGSAAVIIYVNSLPPPATFPAELDGVRTRIVQLSTTQSRSAAAPFFSPQVISEQEVARVSAVKEERAVQLMRSAPAIFGVGVGASDDNPGEAALVLFVDKDMAYTAPTVLEGARTKVYRTDRFRAWGWNESRQPRACQENNWLRDHPFR